jgi:malate/lactate dehydrogenase
MTMTKISEVDGAIWTEVTFHQRPLEPGQNHLGTIRVQKQGQKWTFSTISQEISYGGMKIVPHKNGYATAEEACDAAEAKLIEAREHKKKVEKADRGGRR